MVEDAPARVTQTVAAAPDGADGPAGPGAARRGGQAPGPLARRPWLVPVALLAFLVALTIAVRTNSPVVSLDERIRDAVRSVALSPRWHWIQYRHHSIANTLVNLGRTQQAVPVLLLAAAVAALRQRSGRPLLAAAAGLLLLIVTVIPAKILIGRAGPGLPPPAPGSPGVFPSGHAATAGLCYLLAAALVAPLLRPWLRRAAWAFAAAVTLVVGAALIWCDDHWTSDVVASVALVAAIVWASVRLAPWLAGSLGPRLAGQARAIRGRPGRRPGGPEDGPGR